MFQAVQTSATAIDVFVFLVVERMKNIIVTNYKKTSLNCVKLHVCAH